jgi:2-methylisocitrate lyase-like PEP mutase family enzyme
MRCSDDTLLESGMLMREFKEKLGPLTVIPAVWDVLSAAAAQAAGATHLFLSGAALNNVHGYPDRGLLDIEQVCQVAREITTAISLPLMVDAEVGFGGLPRLARLVDELGRAGVNAIMIEDQDETGQSKRISTPGLCEPEVLCERLETVRAVSGGALATLARTDYLPYMDFTETLERLRMYDAAGADWVIPVFAPSIEDLQRAAADFHGKLMVLAASPPISGVMRYSPSRMDLEVVQPVAVLVTGQYRNAYASLVGDYEMTLDGNWRSLFAARPEPVGFDDSLNINRLGMSS